MICFNTTTATITNKMNSDVIYPKSFKSSTQNAQEVCICYKRKLSNADGIGICCLFVRLCLSLEGNGNLIFIIILLSYNSIVLFARQIAMAFVQYPINLVNWIVFSFYSCFFFSLFLPFIVFVGESRIIIIKKVNATRWHFLYCFHNCTVNLLFWSFKTL